MQFVVFATDRPRHLEVRERTRPEHRRYLRNHGVPTVRVLLAGPTLDPAGNHMNGTFLVIEANCLSDVAMFIAADPYSKAELFERVDIRPWRCGLGAIQPDEQELPEMLVADAVSAPR